MGAWIGQGVHGTEPSADRVLNIGWQPAAWNPIRLVWDRSGPLLKGNWRQPLSNEVVDLIQRMAHPLRRAAHACRAGKQPRPKGDSPSNSLVVALFRHGSHP